MILKILKYKRQNKEKINHYIFEKNDGLEIQLKFNTKKSLKKGLFYRAGYSDETQEDVKNCEFIKPVVVTEPDALRELKLIEGIGEVAALKIISHLGYDAIGKMIFDTNLIKTLPFKEKTLENIKSFIEEIKEKGGDLKKIKKKYNNKKTQINGITFDSKAEAKRYEFLKNKEEKGEIRDLKLQPKFVLQNGFKNNEGKSIRPIYYVADFMYIENEKTIVEDYKGFETADYKIKKKLFMYKYNDIIFKEIKTK